MAHSSMAVEATMEADLGDWNSRAVSPNTHPAFMWILILPPSTYIPQYNHGNQSSRSGKDMIWTYKRPCSVDLLIRSRKSCTSKALSGLRFGIDIQDVAKSVPPQKLKGNSTSMETLAASQVKTASSGMTSYKESWLDRVRL